MEFSLVGLPGMDQEEMASTLTQSPDQLTTTFLQCKICSKVFDDESKHPRLLPCLHTFCYECVKGQIKDGKIKCPICSSVHNAKPENLNASLPRDNTRRDLYDFVRVKRAPSAVSCTGCGKNMANHRCKECAEFLCKECEEAHMKVNQTKGHTLMRLDTLKQSMSMVAFCQPQMCPDHKDKVLELYCSKDSCMKPVCMMCAIVKCSAASGHSISTCDEIALNRKENISRLLGGVREVGSDVSAITEAVGGEIGNVRGHYERTVKEIDDTFDRLKEIVEVGRKKMKENVKQVVDAKIGVLERQKQGLKQHTKRIDDSVAFAEQSLTHTNAPAFLQIEKVIADRLDALKHEQYDREPYEHATFGFHHQGLTEDVQKCIQNEAKIWTASVYLPRTQFKTVNEPVQNADVTVEVSVSDHQGKCPVKSSDVEAFKAVIEEPSGGGTKECAVVSKGGNQLQIIYKPGKAGRHRLHLMVLDKNAGSYEFDVKPDRPPTRVERAQVSVRDNDPPKRPEVPAAADPECPDFTFDATHAHKDVSISPDGKTFQNWSNDDTPELVPNNSRLQRYKGAIGSRGFQNPGRFFYEMVVEFKVKKPLDKSNLVFEIGLARRSSIGTKLVVSGEKYAWSMIAAHHTDCDAICLHIANGSHILFHQKLAENVAGSSLTKTFCFTIDTNFGRFKIVEGRERAQLCVIDGVDASEPLFPVVAGYNPKNVEVNVTLVTGSLLKKP